MPRTRAMYCVVQYLPDPFRAEAANVGVLLSVPSTGELAVRTSTTLARVKKFFDPSADELKRIASGVKSFEHRVKLAPGEFAKEEDLARFAAARADAVRITAPRLAMIADLAADLDELYEKLVGDVEPAATPATLAIGTAAFAAEAGRAAH